IRCCAAFERRHQLVLHRRPVTLQVLHLDVRVVGVPLLDDLLVGFDRFRLECQGLEGELDGAVIGTGAVSGAAGREHETGAHRRGHDGRSAHDALHGCPPERGFERTGLHDFTAPPSSPPTRRRWMIAKKTRLGMVATSAAAASGPSRATPSAPMNFTSVSEMVWSSGVRRSTSANRNSFQADTNANIAAATTPGTSNGATTSRNARSLPAPSIAAASSSSTGMPLT